MNLREQLIRHEGLRLKPYRCPAGKLTIGVGHNLEDNGISEEVAMQILDEDILQASIDLGVAHPEVHELNQARYDVLVNMCFNMGISRLNGFSRMWNAIGRHDFDEAANEMLDSVWAAQVGYRAVELASIMRTGDVTAVQR